MKTKRPSPIEILYGREQYEKGYAEGYKMCSWDARKRRISKERKLLEAFNKYVDYLDDIFYDNRKR